MPLIPAQLAAIEFVRNYAAGRQQWAKQRIDDVLKMSNVSVDQFQGAVDAIRTYANVGVHFHPDRLGPDQRTVVESLLIEGIYKSQFATFISNGKVAPTLGGPRDKWENRLFGDSYLGLDIAGSDRPKYAGLDLMRSADGPCPRFGSCYLLLKPKILERCTFSYRDSFLETMERGTIDCFDDIIAALLVDSFEREFALGIQGLRPRDLIDRLIKNLKNSDQDPSQKSPARNLDFYIEAQVHGDLNLDTDVAALVADRSFLGSPSGEALKQLAEKFSINLFWHAGFSLPTTDVTDDFRGPTMPSLAKRVAGSNPVTAKLIGDAARDVVQNPTGWSDRGSKEEVLQELKLLWHVVIKFGRWGT